MNKNFKDGLNLMSKVTPKRAWNSIQILSSYFYSKMTGNPVHWGMPIAISFEPTTSCNLRCPECPSGLRSFTRPTGMMEEQLYKKTIDELADTLLYLIFYFQGEPYLHPKFFELVEYAHNKGIYTATSTNAHYLTDEKAKKTVESGLDRLIISIDGTTQDVYQQYRVGGNLEKVLEGTRNIIKWKKELKSSTPHVIFQFLVVKPNEHQIEDVKKLAEEMGVDEIGFKTAQIYDYEEGSDLIPTIDKYSRYKKEAGGGYSIKNKFVDHCWKMWHSCVITWDGAVVPCCFDKDAEYKLGDMKRQTFRQLWRGKKYEDFRASLIRSRSEIEMCKNCTEGTQVWA
ncbi:SPASM domain-containing protein [Dyadobacter aurulentus]|uniref:SPASM domain-containing protein n=1 Tax=Dyadobacter sp. UC 10 TaxID=2605428 RepID=UPI0011F2447C|nr:radical SAM protein [Dyadobacter sp. UC 10]KAA0993754.1 radical SAM protein [Dyadobacter sp. UC 10]